MNRIISKWMRLGVLEVASVALLTGFVVAGASAQVLFEQEGQILYSGNPIDQAGIKVGSWGGGICKETTKNGRAIEITPKGLYQGGRIDFTKPVDISALLTDPNAYIQLMARFGGVEKADRWTTGLMMPGMPGGMPGIPGGMMMPGMPGMGSSSKTTGRPVKRIQILLILDSGETLEAAADLSNFRLSEEGQMPLSFPFSALRAKRNLTGTQLKRIVVTGDGTEPFQLTEIRTVRDDSPLRADGGEDKEVARNYKVVFQGYANTGASAVKYSWDFDDSDGVQEEAVGDLVSHKFRALSNNEFGYKEYTVTLTVTDIFGIKEPAVSKIKVKVND